MEIRDGLYGAKLWCAANPQQPVTYIQDEEIPFYFISQRQDEDRALDVSHWLITDLNESNPSNNLSWQQSRDMAVKPTEPNTVEEAAQNDSTVAQPEDLEELAEILSQPLYPQEIMTKINLAFTAGTVFHDRAAQVRILLSAFQDTESLINAALYKAWGKRPNDATLHYINTLRGIEGRILSHIRATTSIGLSDDELRTLLEQDFSDESLRSQHKSLLGQADELVYGIRSNPDKYRASLSSATSKIDRELRRLTFCIQQTLNNIQADPAQRMAILKQVSPLVEQGKACLEISKASTAEGLQIHDAYNQFDAICNYFQSLK